MTKYGANISKPLKVKDKVSEPKKEDKPRKLKKKKQKQAVESAPGEQVKEVE